MMAVSIIVIIVAVLGYMLPGQVIDAVRADKAGQKEVIWSMSATI